MAPSDDKCNNEHHDDNDDRGAVKESVIRMFSRLATEKGAVNLSQGFPNEANLPKE